MESECPLEARNVRFSYGENMVVDDVSFRLARGEMLGILGPNGSGKSTLLRLLLGLLRPDVGTVRCLDSDPRRLTDRGR